jgi:hypothetical protein
MRFNPRYREEVLLEDGTRVSLRLVQPDDKERLAHTLAAMSPYSRTMRFFAARVDFSEAELRHLTELDQVRVDDPRAVWLEGDATWRHWRRGSCRRRAA